MDFVEGHDDPARMMKFHWRPQIGTNIKIHQQGPRIPKIAKFIIQIFSILFCMVLPKSIPNLYINLTYVGSTRKSQDTGPAFFYAIALKIKFLSPTLSVLRCFRKSKKQIFSTQDMGPQTPLETHRSYRGLFGIGRMAELPLNQYTNSLSS